MEGGTILISLVLEVGGDVGAGFTVESFGFLLCVSVKYVFGKAGTRIVDGMVA